jgi:2-succinyl-5-enolpyruvyl-6-hydroxy-3-cyclohexene-1-carboxylate synthase
LPQAGALEPDRFELLFGTPPTSDVGKVARGFGLEVHEVTNVAELELALHATAAAITPAVVRVKVPGRVHNVALHEAVNRAVQLAVQ